MRPEFTHITYVPDMVAATVIISISVVHFITGYTFADIYSFQHGAIGKSATTGIVYLATRTWMLIKMPEHIHQITTVNIIAHLLAFVTKYGVVLTSYGALHKEG